MNHTLRPVILIFLALFSCYAASAQWSRVGDTIAAGNASVRLAIAPDGTLYTAYKDLSSGYVVLRFDGSVWQQLPVPPIRNGAYFFCMETDRNGVPYIATDTPDANGKSRTVVLKFDGTAWKVLGNASRFTRSVPGMEAALAFDATNQPYYAMSTPGTVIHYNGKAWDQIAGAASPFDYLAMSADANGELYCVTADTVVSRYAGSQVWTPLGRSGLSQVNGQASVLTAATDGKLYAGFLPASGPGKSSVHQYDGSGWTQLGQSFRSGYLSHVLIGAGSTPYMFSSRAVLPGDSLRVLRYNGQSWRVVASDPGSGFNSGVAAHDGSLYVAIYNSDTTDGVRVMRYDTRNDALSVPRAAGGAGLRIAPVPAGDELLLTNDRPAWNGLDAVITDLRGQLVQRIRIEPELRIRTSTWAAGVYIVRLPDGSTLKAIKD